MLKKVNEGGVISDNGFSIQIVGPEELEYKYKKNILKLDLGYDPKKRTVYIYANDITCWDYSDNHVDISNKEKEEIIKNIREAVKLLTGNFEVV